jgi:predicted KAP-like P-loop ATPase
MNLAGAIRRYKGGKSLTIGLHGPWGSGKSSLLNFLIEELSKDAPNLVVERFNPWNFSDQNRLLTSFFLFFSGLLKRPNRTKQMEKGLFRLLSGLRGSGGQVHHLLTDQVSS